MEQEFIIARIEALGSVTSLSHFWRSKGA